MANIAVFTASLEGGGAERISLFVTQALAKAGHQVDLVVQRNRGALSQDPVARRYGVDLGAKSDFSPLPLVRYFRPRRPDLIIAMARDAKLITGLASQIEPELPFIISVRGVLERPRLGRFWLRMLGHAPERWLYRRALGAQVTVPAMAMEVDRALAIPRQRITTIPNPVTIDRAPVPLPADHVALFDRPVLVTAGRLEPQKDQAKLIDAFARAGLADHARLLILGTGKLETSLKARATRLGLADSIIFAGYAPDVRPYLERAKGFVLSSTHESFGLVLLEAMACGRPIASFDCPTGPRTLLDHGRFGRLIPPGDVDAMARAMRDLVSGALAPQPQAVIDRHLALYAPDRIANSYAAAAETWLSWARAGREANRRPVSSSPYRPAYSRRSTASSRATPPQPFR